MSNYATFYRATRKVAQLSLQVVLQVVGPSSEAILLTVLEGTHDETGEIFPLAHRSALALSPTVNVERTSLENRRQSSFLSAGVAIWHSTTLTRDHDYNGGPYS